MPTHSSVLSWRIPGTGKPGGLPSMGSHTVGHDSSDLAAAAAAAAVRHLRSGLWAKEVHVKSGFATKLATKNKLNPEFVF